MPPIAGKRKPTTMIRVTKAQHDRYRREAVRLDTTIATIIEARERAWLLLTDAQRRQCLVPDCSLPGAAHPS